jgi:hypothetical protein
MQTLPVDKDSVVKTNNYIADTHVRVRFLKDSFIIKTDLTLWVS